MQLPNILNTRDDYEYVRSNAIPGWVERWRLLLDGRFVVDGDNLVEDLNAPIYRLGFTVDEVSQAIGFDGLTSTEVNWRVSQPDRFLLTDGEWSEISGWAETRNALLVSEAVSQKREEIQREKCQRRDGGIVINGVLYDTDGNADAKYTSHVGLQPYYEFGHDPN